MVDIDQDCYLTSTEACVGLNGWGRTREEGRVWSG